MNAVLTDFVRVTTTTTGTGDLTIGPTVAGYFGLGTNWLSNLDTFYYAVFDVDINGNPSGNIETGIGTYTTVGTTRIIRDRVIRSSNSDALVNFGAGTKHIICSALGRAIAPGFTEEFRLTTESAVPVSVTDQTSKSTLYYTPFNGNILSLWTGKGIERIRWIEMSVALSGLTSGKNYDVVAYIDSTGLPRLDLMPAWTNDTTRASAIFKINGDVMVNNSSFTSVINGDSVQPFTATVVGTIRTTGTTTVEDSEAKRFVWNRYNRVPRTVRKVDATGAWGYTTGSWRSMNGSTANRVEVVRGENIEPVDVANMGASTSSAGGTTSVGVGLDSTSSPTGSTPLIGGGGAIAYFQSGVARYNALPGIGYHYFQALEYGASGGSFFGTNAPATLGLFGTVWA